MSDNKRIVAYQASELFEVAPLIKQTAEWFITPENRYHFNCVS